MKDKSVCRLTCKTGVHLDFQLFLLICFHIYFTGLTVHVQTLIFMWIILSSCIKHSIALSWIGVQLPGKIWGIAYNLLKSLRRNITFILGAAHYLTSLFLPHLTPQPPDLDTTLIAFWFLPFNFNDHVWTVPSKIKCILVLLNSNILV